MFNLKKRLIYQKIEKFILNDNLILVFHYHNIKAKDWVLLKNKLEELSGFEFLTVKNKIVRTVLNQKVNADNNNLPVLGSLNKEPEVFCQNKMSKENLQYSPAQKKKNKLFSACLQGPTLLIKCCNNEKINALMIFMKKQPNFVFVGGFLQNNPLTHLDLEKMQKLDSSVYLELIKQLQLSMQSIFVIRKALDFSYLSTYPLLPFLKILQLKNLK